MVRLDVFRFLRKHKPRSKPNFVPTLVAKVKKGVLELKFGHFGNTYFVSNPNLVPTLVAKVDTFEMLVAKV